MDRCCKRSLDRFDSSERSDVYIMDFSIRWKFSDRFSLQAIRRIVERDHLTADEAKRRLSSQMTNQQRFPHAHVLLCTYWAESVTQQQVERAWNLLMQRIPPNPIQPCS